MAPVDLYVRLGRSADGAFRVSVCLGEGELWASEEVGSSSAAWIARAATAVLFSPDHHPCSGCRHFKGNAAEVLGLNPARGLDPAEIERRLRVLRELRAVREGVAASRWRHLLGSSKSSAA